MKYDERWNTCGIEYMNMWPQLVRDGFTFVRSTDDTDDLLVPGCCVITLQATAPWGESRTVRLEGVEPPMAVIIAALVDASLRKNVQEGQHE